MNEIIYLIKRYRDVDSWIRTSPNVIGDELDSVCKKQERRLSFIIKMLECKINTYSFYMENYKKLIIDDRNERSMIKKFDEIYDSKMKEFLPELFE